MAARRKTLDNTVLPVGYVLTATPQMWLGIVLVWVFASTLAIFPVSGAYDLALQPAWSLEFARSFLTTGSCRSRPVPRRLRRLGDRDAEPDHLRARGRLLQLPAALGAPSKLVRKYAYRNALLPQITGLALALGAVVAGAIVSRSSSPIRGSAR